MLSLSARSVALVVAGAALCGASACRPTPSLGVRLRFPSERAFLSTAVATIDIYDGGGRGEQSPDAICRALSVTSTLPPEGVRVLASSGKLNVCDFVGGDFNIDVTPGRRVVFVEGEDFTGTSVVRGCAVVDIFGDEDADLEGDDAADAEALEVSALADVQLATLPTFDEAAAPACQNTAEKCEQNVSCLP